VEGAAAETLSVAGRPVKITAGLGAADVGTDARMPGASATSVPDVDAAVTLVRPVLLRCRVVVGWAAPGLPGGGVGECCGGVAPATPALPAPLLAIQPDPALADSHAGTAEGPFERERGAAAVPAEAARLVACRPRLPTAAAVTAAVAALVLMVRRGAPLVAARRLAGGKADLPGAGCCVAEAPSGC